MSAVSQSAPNNSDSFLKPSASGPLSDAWMPAMAARTATCPLEAIFLASPCACLSTSASGATLLTSPISLASCAVILSPVKISSAAFDGPTMRGNRCVPPKPGMMPKSISGWPNRARSPAIRIWQAIASSSPPPRQKRPLIAAITGLDDRSILSKIACPWLVSSRPRAADEICATSLRSAPATKTLPAPVNTMTLTAGSAVRAVTAASNCCITASDSALAGG